MHELCRSAHAEMPLTYDVAFHGCEVHAELLRWHVTPAIIHATGCAIAGVLYLVWYGCKIFTAGENLSTEVLGSISVMLLLRHWNECGCF